MVNNHHTCRNYKRLFFLFTDNERKRSYYGLLQASYSCGSRGRTLASRAYEA